MNEKIKEIRFHVTYDSIYTYNPEDFYFEYCEQREEKPSQESFREFCKELIYDSLMEELYKFDIQEIIDES